MATAFEIIRATPVEHETLLVRVDSLLDEARENQARLASNYVEVGILMLEVRETKAWISRSRSWDQYVLDCGQRMGRKRTVLYGVTSVAEQLGPHFDQKQLMTMGISKSQPLAQYVKLTGKKPPEHLVNSALDPTVNVEEFRSQLSQARHEKPEGKEKWRELGGFYASAEEWAEIQRAFAYARVMDEITEDTPDMIVQKRTILAMARECISSWGPLLEKR